MLASWSDHAERSTCMHVGRWAEMGRRRREMVGPRGALHLPLPRGGKQLGDDVELGERLVGVGRPEVRAAEEVAHVRDLVAPRTWRYMGDT
jgi:hypothetical protein